MDCSLSQVVAQEQVAELSASLEATRDELARTEAERARLSSELQATQQELAGTRATLASTQEELADTQAQLAATRATLASTQARAPARMPYAHAVCARRTGLRVPVVFCHTGAGSDHHRNGSSGSPAGDSTAPPP